VTHNVFVVHGRDLGAVAELEKFLRAVGLASIPFEQVAAELRKEREQQPFVADIVVAGIARAEAVIALFTPDEQAVLYDPITGAYQGNARDEARWQGRPNVIFEAGVAWGNARTRTVLATLGGNVQLFSDVGGVHFVQLASPTGKRLLFDHLSAILGNFATWNPDWATNPAAGDFNAVLRQRWKPFDEVHELTGQLAAREVGKSPVSVLEVIQRTLDQNPTTDWSHATAQRFMNAVARTWAKTPGVANDAYWWLVVEGVFRFDNITTWWDDDGSAWKQSVGYALIAERGLRLIERLQSAPTHPVRRAK
jgi:hypothetical protein